MGRLIPVCAASFATPTAGLFGCEGVTQPSYQHRTFVRILLLRSPALEKTLVSDASRRVGRVQRFCEESLNENKRFSDTGLRGDDGSFVCGFALIGARP
jgi:hypothetical protein